SSVLSGLRMFGLTDDFSSMTFFEVDSTRVPTSTLLRYFMIDARSPLSRLFHFNGWVTLPHVRGFGAEMRRKENWFRWFINAKRSLVQRIGVERLMARKCFLIGFAVEWRQSSETSTGLSEITNSEDRELRRSS